MFVDYPLGFRNCPSYEDSKYPIPRAGEQYLLVAPIVIKCLTRKMLEMVILIESGEKVKSVRYRMIWGWLQLSSRKASCIGEVMSELMLRDSLRKSKKQKVPESENNYKGPGGNKPGVLKNQMRVFLGHVFMMG